MSDQVNKLLYEIGYTPNIEQVLSLSNDSFSEWIEERYVELGEALANMQACAEKDRSLEYIHCKLPEIIDKLAWVKADLESLHRSIYNEIRRREDLMNVYHELKGKAYPMEVSNDTV